MYLSLLCVHIMVVLVILAFFYVSRVSANDRNPRFPVSLSVRIPSRQVEYQMGQSLMNTHQALL
jgi:hypothetical protein